MKFRSVILSLLLTCFWQTALAQKQIDVREQTWLGYFNHTRFTDRSGMWMDLQLRLNENFLKEKNVSIARLGYTYFLTDHTRLTAGYGYITHYSINESPDIPEHRPWQQVQWFDNSRKIKLAQYLRVEERYRKQVVNDELTNDYSFAWRFRYNFAMTIPLKGSEVIPKTPFLFLNDELHVNAGKNITNNYFDQNRLFAGLGYQFTAEVNAHLGYLFVFQQLPAGTEYIHINAVRFFVMHNLNFRRDR